jgi:hypothetical protein
MTITTADITNASARVVIKHSVVKGSREEHKLKQHPRLMGRVKQEQKKISAMLLTPLQKQIEFATG